MPHQGETPVIQAKLALISGIRERMKTQYKTQVDAANDLGVGQDQVSRLYHDQHDRFSLDWLVTTAVRLGGHVRLAVE